MANDWLKKMKKKFGRRQPPAESQTSPTQSDKTHSGASCPPTTTTEPTVLVSSESKPSTSNSASPERSQMAKLNQEKSQGEKGAGGCNEMPQVTTREKYGNLLLTHWRPQQRLWQQAYKELDAEEHELVENFEKGICAQIDSNEYSGLDTSAEPSEARGPTPDEMQKLVHQGLDSAKKSNTIKEGIGAGLDAIQFARDIMDEVVSIVPQAAVPWAGICLGLEILANPISEARSNREGILYVLARIKWYWNLAPLLLDEDKIKDATANLRDQLADNIKDIYKKLLSYQLRSICLYHRNWAVVLVRDAVKFDNWANQLNDIKKLEYDVREQIKQYHDESVKEQLQTLNETAVANEKSLLRVLFAVQDLTLQQNKRERGKEDNDCMSALFEADPRKSKSRIEREKGGLLEGSYSWVLDHDDFLGFQNSPGSGLFWVKGNPGKGKTMLLCGIIDHFEKTQSGPGPISYFFCEASKPEFNNATSVLRGLIWYLTNNNDSLIKYVREEYGRKQGKLFEGANVWDEVQGIARAMFGDPSLGNATILIDALDECTTEREALLDFLISVPNIRWIVSSRNWPEIEEKLDNAEHMIKLHLEDNAAAVVQAVDIYINFKVEKLEQSKRYDASTKDRVRRHLAENADGTFLWVALVCQELAKVPRRETEDKLKSYPKGLKKLYMNMLEQISRSDDRTVCQEILAVVSIVYRPITLDELRGLIHFPERYGRADVEAIVQSCGSFLNLSHDDDLVSFVHQSAKDFVLKDASVELDDEPPFEIFDAGVDNQHGRVFSRSLKLLDERLRRNICGLNAPGVRADKVELSDPDPLASVRYCCVYWVDHLQDSKFGKGEDNLEERSNTQLLLFQFLKSKYLQWLEALSLMHIISAGVKAILKLDTVLTKTDLIELQALVQDARRFVLSHRRGIEMAPLQVYASALIFSPTNSLIRKAFHRDNPSWVVLGPRVEPDWNASLQILEGHSKSVNSIACSTDGRLASGSDDYTIKIWDTVSGDCIQTLNGHEGRVICVDFLPDGRIASGSRDRTVKIWDTTTGQCMRTLDDHQDMITSVASSSDGRIASGSWDQTIKIWDHASDKCIRTLEDPDGVTAVAFVNDSYITSGSHNGKLKIWDAEGNCLTTLDGGLGDTWIASAGDRIASVSSDGTVRVWDVTSGDNLYTLSNTDPAASIAFSPDGQRIAVGLVDDSVQIWDATLGNRLQTLKTPGVVRSVTWITGSRIASVLNEDSIKIWDVSAHRAQTFEGHLERITCVAFSPDGQYIASASWDTTIKLWDTSGKCIQTLGGHDSEVLSVTFWNNGRYIASGSYDGQIKIWDIQGYICIQTIQGHGKVISSITSTEDGHRIASGSSDGTIRLWGTSFRCIGTLKGHKGEITSIIFSSDGRHLAGKNELSVWALWEVDTGRLVQKLEGDAGNLRSIAVLKDGELIELCSDERTTIWDAMLGQSRRVLEGYHALADVMVNAPDEQLAALDVSHGPPGCGISSDGCWITWKGEAILWWPKEYRPMDDEPQTVASKDHSIAIGTSSGRLWTMQLASHIGNMPLV